MDDERIAAQHDPLPPPGTVPPVSEDAEQADDDNAGKDGDEDEAAD